MNEQTLSACFLYRGLLIYRVLLISREHCINIKEIYIMLVYLFRYPIKMLIAVIYTRFCCQVVRWAKADASSGYISSKWDWKKPHLARASRCKFIDYKLNNFFKHSNSRSNILCICIHNSSHAVSFHTIFVFFMLFRLVIHTHFHIYYYIFIRAYINIIRKKNLAHLYRATEREYTISLPFVKYIHYIHALCEHETYNSDTVYKK